MALKIPQQRRKSNQNYSISQENSNFWISVSQAVLPPHCLCHLEGENWFLRNEGFFKHCVEKRSKYVWKWPLSAPTTVRNNVLFNRKLKKKILMTDIYYWEIKLYFITRALNKNFLPQNLSKKNSFLAIQYKPKSGFLHAKKFLKCIYCLDKFDHSEVRKVWKPHKICFICIVQDTAQHNNIHKKMRKNFSSTHVLIVHLSYFPSFQVQYNI